MTIAIVDGYSTGAALARRLQKQGAQCVHLQSRPEANAFLGQSFEAGAYSIDLGYIADLRTVTDRLTELGATRVTAGSESGVTLAETIAHRLGLPTNSATQRGARRDKHLMAQAVRSAGLATPLATLAHTPDSAATWFETSKVREAVVKPIASAGTDNVRFCRTPHEVKAAAAAILGARTVFGEANHAVLVQERLHGTEFYINTVSHDGHHRVAEMWRYTKQLGEGSIPVYDYEEPIATTTEEGRILRQFTVAVLDALGIRSSPAHTEVMLTDRGPVLIESGARLGGATDPDVVERYCGISQTGLAAQALVDPQALVDFDDTQTTWTGTVRNVEFVNHRTGRADGTAPARVNDLPSAVSVHFAVAPGELLAPTGDLLSSPGYAYLAAGDRCVVERDYELLRIWEREGLHTV